MRNFIGTVSTKRFSNISLVLEFDSLLCQLAKQMPKMKYPGNKIHVVAVATKLRLISESTFSLYDVIAL